MPMVRVWRDRVSRRVAKLRCMEVDASDWMDVDPVAQKRPEHVSCSATRPCGMAGGPAAHESGEEIRFGKDSLGRRGKSVGFASLSGTALLATPVAGSRLPGMLAAGAAGCYAVFLGSQNRSVCLPAGLA